MIKMRIFALSDPHLSTVTDKPMNVFGMRWQEHDIRIKENWIKNINEDDIVLIPGDISWGLKFEEVIPDLEWISKLPGLKLITKGNHDLWWTSLKRLNSLFDNMIFLHNNHYDAGGIAICGTRGWTIPQMSQEWTDHDEKIFRRELLRLDAALQSAQKTDPEKIIVAMHYPPTDYRGHNTAFTDVIEKYNVSDVVYGHLHGNDASKSAFNGKKAGIRYRLVSSDCINFCPQLIYEKE